MGNLDDKKILDELGIHLSGNKILDKNLKFEIELLTLKKARQKYPNLRYKVEVSTGCLGVVKLDPDLGYVFHVVKYKGINLV